MNKCMFFGKLTDDPVLKEINGTHVVNFAVGVEDTWKNAAGEESKRYDYADFEIWDSGAKKFCEQARKGDFVLLDTSFRVQKWMDDEQNSRRKVLFRVNKFEVIKNK